MATKTTNYGLTKPAAEEYYDIAVPNANMDLIDAAIKANADAISGAGKVTRVKVSDTGWSTSAPYTQTITASGMTASSTPVISGVTSVATTNAEKKAIQKAWGKVDQVETLANAVKLTCKFGAPTISFYIDIKGV